MGTESLQKNLGIWIRQHWSGCMLAGEMACCGVTAVPAAGVLCQQLDSDQEKNKNWQKLTTPPPGTSKDGAGRFEILNLGLDLASAARAPSAGH